MVRHDYVAKNVRNVDAEIRRRVVAEAVEREVTLSDVIGSAIAAAWAIPYELSGQKATGLEATGDQFVVRIPQEMATRIWLISRSRGITESGVVQELLADRYGVEYVPARRGRQPKEAA